MKGMTYSHYTPWKFVNNRLTTENQFWAFANIYNLYNTFGIFTAIINECERKRRKPWSLYELCDRFVLIRAEVDFSRSMFTKFCMLKLDIFLRCLATGIFFKLRNDFSRGVSSCCILSAVTRPRQFTAMNHKIPPPLNRSPTPAGRLKNSGTSRKRKVTKTWRLDRLWISSLVGNMHTT